ncbi:6-phospho-3-hexuloisomerase [Staphylococcus carnosus]|uniref:Hexose phosphate isomerase n=1 Tax=Staphylococcus carnosus (strain TM300) TaxID=396513 RepID=B9DQ31_STACT|nr:6-phospho-3-hexuloisomerase [Staphylococcus carnosus]QPT03790.1 6-phospho-3-hexuloisomerase [Staphylococcus carnosus]UQA66515.1 6-phospho-3-hexuloisomerase [Staphylococcus carnosus]UTB78655.1 6-phospho 3-hexuloisomerase [Staphylococcus carnosus]UTB88205.1 6-phospho 3-hexuloisomerase [Staphylococcus carnosus]UTB90556.1 6-phospho 3-hexuloisomerase [Staphylococcus carnosus]
MTELRYQLILDELKNTLGHVKSEEVEQFENEVRDAKNIFTASKGRSGYVSNSFAMRLNQLGKASHVIGGASTPSIHKGDLFIVISGSGSTEHLRLLADKAKGEDAKVVLITTKPDSKIGEIADTVIELPAGTKFDAEGSEQPLGSLFEQSAQIFLDAVVLDLMEIFNIDETAMQQNHANLE